MTTIAFAGVKGGTSKSQLAALFTTYLLSKGEEVHLVDLDEGQRTSEIWANDRRVEGFPCEGLTVAAYDSGSNIAPDVKVLQQKFANVLIDCAGRDSLAQRSALTVAEIAIIPFRPAQPDLNTVEIMGDIIKSASALNPKLKAVAVITLAHPSTTEAKEAGEYLRGLETLDVVEAVIRDRRAWRDASRDGRSVLELGDIKAKAEAMALIKEVL